MGVAADGLARRTVGARTGGRSERVVRDVLRATIDELARSGYAALRVDDVAARAGVNKTTVYRRWPTKTDLVAAAIRASAGQHEPVPDTGSARRDLVERSSNCPHGRPTTLRLSLRDLEKQFKRTGF